MDVNEDIIIDLTQKLLKSIDTHNWETYVSLTSENISCIEAESSNRIVIGMDFHKFFFEKTELCLNTTFTSIIIDPHVKIFGNTALIAYIRKLVIHDSLAGSIKTIELAETRVWNFEEESNSWKMVHFHKS